MISLVIFLVGCIGAAAAWNIWVLIAFGSCRARAAGLPLSFAIIKDEFPPERSGCDRVPSLRSSALLVGWACRSRA